MAFQRLRRNSNPAQLKNVRHIVGIACTGHGASLAYIGREGAVRSSVLERWSGVKQTLMFSADEDRDIRHPQSEIDNTIHGLLVYGHGRFPETRVFEETLSAWLEWLLRDLDVAAADIDLLVTSESHFATSQLRLGPHLRRWFPNAHTVSTLEHHQIHQRQAFWQSGFDEAAVLTLDTCGEYLARLDGRKLSGTLVRMNTRGETLVLNELCFPESSAGLLYDIVNFHVGFHQGDEGKTMGLAAYGGPELFEQLRPYLTLDQRGGFRFLSASEFQAALDRYVPARQAGAEITERHMHVAYAGQALLDAIVTNAFRSALRLSGVQDLAYAGGIALNSVANEIARRETQPRRLYIATNPGDPGHALGCALFGAYEVAGWTPPRQELREYLGPTYSSYDIEAALRSCAYACHKPDNLAAMLAQCIANGHIVARFDGGAEFGPRALGNRSILCDPRRADMKDYLNARVKHREGFRPFAPTVLAEQAANWFELDGRSTYMLRVVAVRPECRARIPAIVHVDGTARVQTLTCEENAGYWEIVNAFYTLTGVPLILNTSFNLAGKPIVETPADAVECFAATDIDMLALGTYVLSKRPLETYVQMPCEAHTAR